jgi:hypothetical protein
VVVRIQATPERADDGAKLADEVMAALTSVTGEHEVQAARERAAGGDGRAGTASPGDGQQPQRRSRTDRVRR